MPVRQGVKSPYLTSSNRVGESASSTAAAAADKDTTALIDNSRNIYVRVRLRRCGGVALMCRPQVFWSCPKVLQVLHADVCEVLAMLPPSLHKLVQRIPIFVNHEYAYGLKRKPQRVVHTTAHHHYEWLLW